ncbi:MAG: hypothetical protein E6K82_03985 [Candidatus Rokuibacteriota bacterium]|nr:MAG: hypothetical protein E6K82_03985 [Candidatus Rokubacteria bacterium]
MLRRGAATPGDIADDGVLQADWIVHVVSRRADAVAELCGEAAKALSPAARVRVLYARLLAERLAALGLGGADLVAIDSLTAQKRLVEAGFGLGLLPESSVHEELRLGTLRALDAPAMRLAVPVVLVHRRRGYLSGAARALMALLAERR